MIATTAAVVLLLDSVFLYAISPHFTKQIASVQGTSLKVDFLAAAVCYALIIFAIHHFIVVPKRSLLDAFLLGLIVYGVYETTSKALLSKWMWKTVVIDTLWGGVLFALTTFILRKWWLV